MESYKTWKIESNQHVRCKCPFHNRLAAPTRVGRAGQRTEEKVAPFVVGAAGPSSFSRSFARLFALAWCFW
jgi:hypothetical protein